MSEWEGSGKGVGLKDLIVSLCYRKLSDGLFLKECENAAELYPGIEFNSMIIDNCCMQVSSFLSVWTEKRREGDELC